MSEYLLEIEASAVFSSEAPTLEILVDGVVVSSFLIEEHSGSGLSYLQYNLSYSGEYPGSLSFRFMDSGSESGRSITIDSFSVNGFDGTSYVGMLVMQQGQSSSFDTNGFFGGEGAQAGAPPFTEDMPDLADLDPVTITGTAGDDQLSGLGGHIFDVIDGGAGNDVINGQRGDDQIWGGDGDDVIFGNEDNDTIIGADGDDNLQGGQGDDNIWGGEGNDKLSGGDGNDNLSGNEGNDKVYGNDGNDVIYGGDGHDKLYGQLGDDEIHGGDGNDKIYGNEGNNTIYGDGGDDKIFLAGGTSTAYGGTGNDKILGSDNDDISYGEDGDDVLAGYDGNDTLYGGDGYDRLYGHAGDDTIYGGDGDDFILAHDGRDTVDGGDGNDQIAAEAGNDTLSGGAGDDLITGGAGRDTISGNDDNDTLIGGADRDRLSGDAGNDILHGHGLSNVEVNQILNANPNVVFSKETNSFYQWVSTTANYATAEAAAQAATLNGLNGHLANITSAVEQAYVDALVGNNVIWLGGTDMDTEGQWVWTDGIEAGNVFYDTSQPLLNDYNDFYTGVPYLASLGVTNSDALLSYAPLGWLDYYETNSFGYLIEWEAGLMNDDNAIDVISGGAGNDMIYGYGGNDTLRGGADDDIIYGGNGNDTIRGGGGQDNLYGDAGNDAIDAGGGDDLILGGAGNDDIIGGNGDDVIYADGLSTTDMVAEILAANPNVYYNESTGNFYQHITTNMTWNVASTNANSTTLNGVNGHLATISSDGEESFITGTVMSSNTWSWTAGSDAASEGVWQWQDGPENGDTFWNNGDVGEYTNWYLGTPYLQSLGYGTADYLAINQTLGWLDIWSTYSTDSIIEWEGDLVLGTAGTDTLAGGDGLDVLYGADGQTDIFVFESASAYNDTDIINNFTAADGDALDISDLLTGFVDGSSDINDFVQFTNSGADTLVQVDANGTSGGASFTTIAQISNVNDLDADALYFNTSIIV